MPKIKIKGAVKKRLRLTASGKIKRKQAFAAHMLAKKSGKRRRRLRVTTLVSPSDTKRMKQLLRG